MLHHQQSRQQLDPQLVSSRSRSHSPGGDSLLTVRIPSDGSVINSESSSVADGLANLNRWSQSTVSSAISADCPPTAFKHDHSHGFSSVSNASLWARRNAHAPQSPEDDVSPRSIARSQRSIAAAHSPEYRRRGAPKLEKPLPPAMSAPSHSPSDGDILLTATSYTPSSSGLLTPASYSNLDYFGSSTTPGEKNAPRVSSRNPSSVSRHPDGLSHRREKGEKDKKTMLSKALEKANTAVLLDNALNYEGALEAYQDACRLLESVMDRTTSLDDKRKLDAIRDTYNIRVEELMQLQMTTMSSRRDKQLPPRPTSDESLASLVRASIRDSVVAETVTMSRNTDLPSPTRRPRTSFLTAAIREVEGGSSSASFLGPLWERERSKSPYRDSTFSDRTARPNDELDTAFMPRPLTPHRQDDSEEEHQAQPVESNEARKAIDPVSWLDTIDESGSASSFNAASPDSRSASMHSRSQSGLHRRDLSSVSRMNLDFEAAFDAAVEAAYEDGYELDDQFLPAQEGQAQSGLDLGTQPLSNTLSVFGDSHLDDDEAEEERILDDITNDYIDHGFDFDIQSKSALPRQSDSSTYSGSTRHSSQVSRRTTAGTSLSTVAEKNLSQVLEKASSHTPSSSIQTDSSKVSPELSTDSGAQQANGPSRRVAGPNFKQLKIETTRRHAALRSRGLSGSEATEAAESAGEISPDGERRISEVPSLRRVEAALASPYHMRSAASDTMNSMSLDGSAPPDSGDTINSHYRSPRPRMFRGKTRSSLSLRDQASSISEENIDTAPVSPASAYQVPYSLGSDVLLGSRRYVNPSLGSLSISRTESSGGYHVFENFVIPPSQPPSPGADDSLSPSSLEPCPESLLLRPFWLLRCVASTINQPRGGFLTTRLFVPRQVWMNSNVKLKGIEEKVANCDLLTAALGRLANVDTFDADAVLEELQIFEEVMERVQTALTKKLGNDVGVHGIGALFKDAPASIDSTGSIAEGLKDSVKVSTGKSYLTSWRKLRGKNSSGGITIPLSSTRGDKEAGMMASVPMTSFLPFDKRTAHKRDPSRDMAFEGPYKEYMGSLARLCEAAQVLDQVARQVEDPGLKHSSPTHIGLELSTRHAAEFFGFFVCRIVLGDLGLLMDKFLKRNTEWIVT